MSEVKQQRRSKIFKLHLTQEIKIKILWIDLFFALGQLSPDGLNSKPIYTSVDTLARLVKASKKVIIKAVDDVAKLGWITLENTELRERDPEILVIKITELGIQLYPQVKFIHEKKDETEAHTDLQIKLSENTRALLDDHTIQTGEDPSAFIERLLNDALVVHEVETQDHTC